MIHRAHYHLLPSPDCTGQCRNSNKNHSNHRTRRNQFVETSKCRKPILAQITSNTMLHERKLCNYYQKIHVNKKWLNITAVNTISKKVTDFYGMLD